MQTRIMKAKFNRVIKILVQMCFPVMILRFSDAITERNPMCMFCNSKHLISKHHCHSKYLLSCENAEGVYIISDVTEMQWILL